MKHTPIPTLRIAATAFSLSFAIFNAAGQDSSSSYTPKAPRESRNVSSDATGSLSALGPKARESTPLQMGPFLFRPGITYSYTDADNLLRGFGDSENSVIERISASLAFEYRELWSLNYTPSWTYYSNDRFEDNDAHSVNLSTDFALQDWGMGFSQTYNTSNGSLIETGSQTEQDLWGTTLSASRQLNSAWYLDLSTDQDLRSTKRFSDVSEWSGMGWLRHQSSSTANSSLGLGYGYADIDPGLNTKYMQALVRFGLNPTDKLTLSLQGGIDFREVDAPGFEQDKNPTYNASLQYQAFDYTMIAVNIDRQISASYFSNFNNETESITLSLSQRLLGRLNLTVSYGEQSSEYLDLFNEFIVGRSDDYNSFSVDLSTQLANRISLSAFYRNNENSTNTSGFGFSSDQTGFQIGYRY